MYNIDNLKKLDCLNSYRICLANMYIEIFDLALFPNNNCDRCSQIIIRVVGTILYGDSITY